MTRIPMTTKTFEQVAPGTYPARLIWLFDLGDQESTFNNETTINRKVYCGWELVNERMTDGRPFMVARTYNASLHPKSALGQHVGALLGRVLTREDEAKFDLATLLGTATLVTVAATENDRRKITGVAGVPRDMIVPAPANELLYFALVPGVFSEGTLAKVPEFWRDLIMKSPQYRMFAEAAEHRESQNTSETLVASDEEDFEDLTF